MLTPEVRNYILMLFDQEFDQLQTKQKMLIENIVTWEDRDELYAAKDQADNNRKCRAEFIAQEQPAGNVRDKKNKQPYNGLVFHDIQASFTPTTLAERICREIGRPTHIDGKRTSFCLQIAAVMTEMLRPHRPTNYKNKKVGFPVHLFENAINSEYMIQRINKIAVRNPTD